MKYALVRILPDGNSPKLSEFIRDYLERARDHNLARNTIRLYGSVLRKLAAYLGADLNLGDITEAQANGYSHFLSRQISGHSRRTHTVILQSAFAYAREKDLIGDNVFKEFDLPPIEFAGRVLTDDEINGLLCFVNDTERRACLLSLHTGMRIGEIASLAWTQVRGDVVVVTADKSKSGRERIIPVSPETLRILGEPRACGSVFGLTARSLRASMTRAWRAYGHGRIRFHDFRHTACTRFFEESDDVFAACAIFGWSSPQSAKPYQHMTRKRLNKALLIRYPGVSSYSAFRAG